MKYTARENNILVSFKRITWLIGLLIGTTIPSVSSGEIQKSSHHDDGYKRYSELVHDNIMHQQDMDWISSVLSEVITRQNKRLSFLENYVARDQNEKMRTMAFKERMDKEEIVHLKHEVDQLKEIANSFQHSESSSHFISKRQAKMKPPATPLSWTTSGNCAMVGRFCPYPDRPTDASDFVSFVVQKHVPYSNANNTHQIQFEEVLLNFGGAFNMKESVFIAPKSGLYEFNFDGHKSGDPESLNISLRVNGKDTVNAWSHFLGSHPSLKINHDFRNLISMHSLLKLRKGDRIDILNKQGSLHDGSDGNIFQYTKFTGKLLLPEDTKTKNISAVYFNAQKNVSYCNSEKSVPFEIVNLNLGDAFNWKQQEFIIPITGIYEFTVKGFKTGTEEEMELSLRLNEDEVANAWADCLDIHEFFTPFSIYSILKVEKGDRIDLFLDKGCLYDDSNHYTTFTGKLLMENGSISNTTGFKPSPTDAVFFNVQRNLAYSTSNDVISFDVGALNFGGAFNLTDNFFTAPKSGVYEFNVAGIRNYQNGNYRNFYIAIRLNRWPVAYVWVDYIVHHKLHTPFSLHSILKMKKGDLIDLFLVGEESEVYDGNKRLTHFTGKLLFPTDMV